MGQRALVSEPGAVATGSSDPLDPSPIPSLPLRVLTQLHHAQPAIKLQKGEYFIDL